MNTLKKSDSIDTKNLKHRFFMIMQNMQYIIGHIYVLLFLICLGTASCVKEESFSVPEHTPSDALIKLTVHTPSVAIPEVITTRSQTENEARIQEITVMVFQNDKFQYQADGSITSSTITSTTFDVVLKSSSSPLTLYLLANSNEVLSNSGILKDDSKEVVKDKLKQSFTNTGIASPFPMFGEHELSSFSTNTNNDISGIKMLRSIARADVLVSDAVTNFELVSIQLFRANNKMQLIPDVMTNASVTSPSIPDDAQANVSTSPFTVTGNNSESQLYFPESVAPTENNRVSDATCIVIGGKYNGSSTTTYYRIDFNPGIEGHPFGQILRNHKYIFNITKVELEGEITPENAANTESTGIVVEVQTWDEQSVEMWYERETYFSVSARMVFLQTQAGSSVSSGRIEINTNLSGYSIQWSDVYGDTLSDSSTSETSISDENFTVSIVNDGITVVAKTTNSSEYDRFAYFVIHAGRWDIVMTIDQYGTSKYTDDLIRVLSFNEIGALGNGYAGETTDANAVAMRQILNVQFSRTGLFKFGGFHFTELDRLTTGTTYSDVVFSNYDVILFPYNQQQNQTVSDAVIRWLNAKDYRVLILGADATNTNVNLLATVGDNLGWTFSHTGLTTQFDVVFSEEAKEFTETGLFGSITPGSYFNINNGTWGRATVSNPQVIPLLTASNGDMVIGVNTTKRIVYIGEMELFYYRTGALSNANGIINDDRDRFMANLWAWVAEVVLSGK